MEFEGLEAKTWQEELEECCGEKEARTHSDALFLISDSEVSKRHGSASKSPCAISDDRVEATV